MLKLLIYRQTTTTTTKVLILVAYPAELYLIEFNELMVIFIKRKFNNFFFCLKLFIYLIFITKKRKLITT